MEVKFSVLGEPQGKGRPRFYRVGNGVRTATPAKTEIYENLIQMEYRRQCKDFRFPEKQPLAITVEAYFSIPKSTSKKNRALMLERVLRPVKKPDGDNILKAVCDGLNKVAYSDDAQIIEFTIRKYYDEAPRLEVKIQEV